MVKSYNTKVWTLLMFTNAVFFNPSVSYRSKICEYTKSNHVILTKIIWIFFLNIMQLCRTHAYTHAHTHTYTEYACTDTVWVRAAKTNTDPGLYQLHLTDSCDSLTITWLALSLLWKLLSGRNDHQILDPKSTLCLRNGGYAVKVYRLFIYALHHLKPSQRYTHPPRIQRSLTRQYP